MTRAEQIEACYEEHRQLMADACCAPADETTDGWERVCPGCCRMVTDCALIVLIDTPFRQSAGQRCGECRARIEAERAA
jgi:hypothetical protein